MVTKVTVGIVTLLNMAYAHNPATHWQVKPSGHLVIFDGDDEVGFYRPTAWLWVRKEEAE
jgi:hypothetical protein